MTETALMALTLAVLAVAFAIVAVSVAIQGRRL